MLSIQIVQIVWTHACIKPFLVTYLQRSYKNCMTWQELIVFFLVQINASNLSSFERIFSFIVFITSCTRVGFISRESNTMHLLCFIVRKRMKFELSETFERNTIGEGRELVSSFFSSSLHRLRLLLKLLLLFSDSLFVDDLHTLTCNVWCYTRFLFTRTAHLH